MASRPTFSSVAGVLLLAAASLRIPVLADAPRDGLDDGLLRSFIGFAPEPKTMILVGIGLVAVALLGGRRRDR